MKPRKRLGDLLIESGIITDQQLQQALTEQSQSGLKLGDFLISRGYITEQQKIEVLEFQLGIPHVQLYRETVDDRFVRVIPPALAKKYMLMPLRMDKGKLVVAMADPLDYYATEEVRMATGFQVAPVIATTEELTRAINRYYSLQADDVVIEQAQIEEVTDVIDDQQSPVVRLVNQMIEQALSLGASDIHLDPQENIVRVRFRVDGVLRTEKEYPRNMLDVIIARLKIVSNLNIAEKRLPQDGRFEMEINFRKIDVRISTLPTIHGEKTVLRILDTANTKRDLQQLGFSSHNLEQFKRLISAPNGLVLITGPTGSGKTTTLYSALREMNRDDVNIVTVEDPVEYQLERVNQVQVNHATGLSFAQGLRSILRQDPNIIMVGEIRDTETAEMAIRAALTGHLVLSTLHTNEAISTLNRLIDMGVEPFLVSSSVRGIVAQRLLRKLCPACKVKADVPADQARILAEYGLPVTAVYVPQGCAQCSMTGYRGRLAIHEVVVMDESLRRLVIGKKSDAEYRDILRKTGFVSMFGDGLHKVAAGDTSLTELLRATRED